MLVTDSPPGDTKGSGSQMKIEPLVSVIVPLYNQERYVSETLDSLLNQQIADLQVLVVDDGSTDRSPDLVRRYERMDRRISLVTNTRKKGVSGARNTGLDLARGTWIYFIDSDDFLATDALKALLAYACDEFGASIIAGDSCVTDSSGTKGKDPFFLSQQRIASQLRMSADCQACYLENPVPDFLKSEMCLQVGTAIFKRDLIERVGRFNEAMSHSEDTDYWYRLTNRARMILTRNIILYRRIHASSATRNLEAVHNGSINCYEGLLHNPEFAEHADLIRARITQSRLGQSYYYRRIGRFAEGGKTACMVLRSNPASLPAWKCLLGSILRR